MGDVSGLIDSLAKDEKIIMTTLRSLILEAAPAIQEKRSYGVPYFFHHRRICFLWPASLIPSNIQKPPDVKVTLGLCYGNELSNTQGLLQAGNRKQVYVIPIHSLKDVQERLITEIILEAVMVDDEFGKQKKKKKKYG